jgi:hypothetical protein
MDMRKILELIEETSVPLTEGINSPNIQVMSLEDFVNSEHKDIDEALEEANDKEMFGANFSKLSDDELKAYLDRILQKKKSKSDKYNLPYIHGSSIPIVDQNGKEYDLDKLRAQITERPKKILKQNEKMKHSDGSSTIYFNVGLPALRGLAVNEKNGDFVVVNTCPQAGSCKLLCFAMKGGYVQYKATSEAQTRLVNYLLNDPDGFMRQLKSEIKEAHDKYSKKNTKVAIRWHDAGDFFSPEYMRAAYSLAREMPDVDFYAYTKIADVAKADKPENFKINFSMGSQPSQEKQIDYTVDKHSKIVPKEVFTDLVKREPIPGKKPNKKGKIPTRMVYKDKQSIDALKQRISHKYSIKPETILTYDEMMNKPKGKEMKWNVIVKPGDGDDSANRNDVLGTYLLEH